ncbi:hypothetical protein H0H92_015347 [Tricholoma furcatifolium]|nr:hypothetical protein H0H92_015347 [Tricholoma furcatifolium]
MPKKRSVQRNDDSESDSNLNSPGSPNKRRKIRWEQQSVSTSPTQDHASDEETTCEKDEDEIRPHKEFSPSKGRDRLLCLQLLADLPYEGVPSDSSSPNVGSNSANAYDFMRKRREIKGDPTLGRWNALIRLLNFAAVDSSPLCMASIGALLDHIVRKRAIGDLDDEGIGGLDIRSIEILSLSLQIFENESHASVHSDKTKEGLSLYGILNMTNTNMGRSLLRTWLLRPSLSLDVINKRHDAVECFIRPENLSSVKELHTHLKGIKNVPRMLSVLKTGKAKVSDWQGLLKFTFHATMLRESLTELYIPSKVEIVEKLLTVLDVEIFKDIGRKINETVDWEESLNAGRPCVRPHVDDELDNRKHVDYVYFKSQEMHDMDIHIGDLHSTIVDREIEIIQCLLDDILMHDAAIGQACDICAELDCLLSFTEASHAYNYRRPIMVEDNIIDIYQGRHPLQEQVVDTFVPNDARLVGGAGLAPVSQAAASDYTDWDSVLLCMGANACGKSVYLKQIALIQYMAQVQSAFMIDLNQVSLALRNCTARSLIILDEFGKGTLSTGSYLLLFVVFLIVYAAADGAGLFCAVLQHFLRRGKSCPKVLAATHFHDVFCPDFLDPQRSRISFRHMEVMFTASDGSLLPDNDDADTETETDGARARRLALGEKITYLYRVAEGLSLDSHAAKCAEMFGIPSRIVQRAQYVSHLLSTHELRRLLDESMTDEERIDLQDAEAVCRRFLAWDLDSREQEADAKTMLARCLGRESKKPDEKDTA